MIGQRLGAWVPLDEVADVWAGVISVFRDYGYRRLRHRARIKFLVKDWGVAKFREVLETEYLKRPLLDGPAPEVPDRPRDHVGVHPQQDGNFYVGAAPIAGPGVRRARWSRSPKAAERVGSHRVRFTPQQKLVVLDVAEVRSGRSARGAAELGLHDRPVAVAARRDGLHRHRVLQARDRRDQGPRRGPGGARWRSGSRTSPAT